MQIVTDRLVLRSWRESDRDQFAAMNNDPDIMQYFPSTQSREVSDISFDTRVAHDQQHGFCFWATELKETGAFIGFVGMEVVHDGIPYAGSPEIGWRLDKNYWGLGLAPEGAKACLAYAFSNLKAAEVVSFTTTNNLPSQRVMQKIGMKHEPEHDFDHPDVPDGSPLRRHVLYRITPSDVVYI